MKKAALIISVVMCSITYGGEIIKNTTILFNTNDSELSDDYEAELTKFLKNLDLTNDYQIVISGHTDNRGSYAYNDNLSYKRAGSVKAFLILKGVNKESIFFDFYGERKPTVDNNDAEKMRKNRRVEIIYKSFSEVLLILKDWEHSPEELANDR